MPKDKVENPEEVIKQGTLEEAAQALIQLELNEATTAVESGEEEVPSLHFLQIILFELLPLTGDVASKQHTR